MRKKAIDQITTAEQARQYAIDWQNWQSEQAMSYGELAEWHQLLEELVNKFDLVEEFKKNGII